jgi:hypothetical protein
MRCFMKDRIDTFNEKPLFVPKINQYNPEVFKKAYESKVSNELNDKSRLLEKKLRCVFNYFALNKPILKIQEIDSINIRNECILLLKNIIICLIQSKNNLTFDEFVDLMIDKDLLTDIEHTYDFLKKSTAPPISMQSKNESTRVFEPSIRKSESNVTKTLKSEFDKSVRALYKFNLAGQDDFERNGNTKVSRKTAVQVFK